MRVRMAYSVELENIPAEAKKLLVELKEWYEELGGVISKLDRLDTDFFKYGEDARIKLTKIDARLEDCISIISGYNEAVVKVNVQQQEGQQEVSDGEEVQEG